MTQTSNGSPATVEEASAGLRQISVTLKPETISRVDAEQEQCGVRSRSNFVDILLVEALDARQARRLETTEVQP